MSYDLWIWEPPADRAVPAGFDEAARQARELAKVPQGVNKKMVALAEKMATRTDAGWTGDPVSAANALEQGVWGIELPEAGAVNLLRFIVSAANGLGLAVLDDQLGMAFLPGGAVHPEHKRALWAELRAEIGAMAPAASKDQARRRMLDVVGPVFGAHGFEARKVKDFDMEFERSLDEGGAQSVRVRLQGTGPYWRYWVVARGVDQRVQEIIEAACLHSELESVIAYPQTFSTTLGLLAGIAWDSGGTVEVGTPEKLHAMLTALSGTLMPAMERAQGIQGLDLFLNGEYSAALKKEQWELSLAPPVVARLAGRRSFDEYLAEYEPFVAALPSYMKDRLEPNLARLIPYLRERVTPAANI